MNYLRKIKIYYNFGIKPSNDKEFDKLIELIESIFKYEYEKSIINGNIIYKKMVKIFFIIL